MEKAKQRPVHEVTLAFNSAILKASIWKHQSGKEPPRFTVSFSRGYRPKDGTKWIFTDFFSRDELLGLSRIAEVSHGWIVSSDVSEGAKHE
jgi:hypothetical protein